MKGEATLRLPMDESGICHGLKGFRRLLVKPA